MGATVTSTGPAVYPDFGWCKHCRGMHYLGEVTTLRPDGSVKGKCPAHTGGHEREPGLYCSLYGPGASGEAGWRCCKFCAGVFWLGPQNTSWCPAGGRHSAVSGAEFVISKSGGLWRW